MAKIPATMTFLVSGYEEIDRAAAGVAGALDALEVAAADVDAPRSLLNLVIRRVQTLRDSVHAVKVEMEREGRAEAQDLP